jgi:exodeoxyribonuclease VII large subunit
MQVEVRALPTLYEARGDFQLNVETMRRSGLGALFEAFERLKKKLEQEGLFEASRKKAIPAFPLVIGIVTSPKAAALRDVLTTLTRRMPAIRIVLYPAPGEGGRDGAVIWRSARADADVLIVCRGGGSMEDLWAFNEEAVARAIADCAIPVISGVGHETDFTIADFVADARAPTPTAAAELASPNREELLARLSALYGQLKRSADRLLEARMQQLDYLGSVCIRRRAHRIPGPAFCASGDAAQVVQPECWTRRRGVLPNGVEQTCGRCGPTSVRHWGGSRTWRCA